MKYAIQPSVNLIAGSVEYQQQIHDQLSVPIGPITARKTATKLTPTVSGHCQKTEENSRT
jgi:hypothetical protein